MNGVYRKVGGKEKRKKESSREERKDSMEEGREEERKDRMEEGREEERKE